MLSESPNFSFLESHSPKLGEIAASAERLVLNDPPACLGKLRLFGEWMSNDILARNGIDGSELKQVERLQRLRDTDLVPSGVNRMLDVLRYWGNEAAHEDKGDGRQSLHALATAQRLAIWFHRVIDGTELPNTDFLTPPDPIQVTNELREALDEQRQLAAALRMNLELRDGIISTLEESRVELQRAAEKAWTEAHSHELEAIFESEERVLDAQAYQRQIAEWKLKAAEATPPENVRAFIDRGVLADERLGVQRDGNDHVPLAQIRVQGPGSSCCNKPTLLVQKSRKSGVVHACCTKCHEISTLSRSEFYKLDVWVSCPKCHERMQPARPNSYYGYECQCGEKPYLLASLLPLHTEL